MIAPKVLIDTNVIIGLEDFGQISNDLATLHQSCQTHNISLYVHEASKKDVQRDKDSLRRSVILSKIDKFLTLDGIPEPPIDDLITQYGAIKKHNDIVDCLLLHSLVHVEAVDFLITQDRDLRRRAERIGYGDRVFSVEDALAWIKQSFEKASVVLPYIEEKICHQVNQSDNIFNSLRDDYANFDKWYKDSCVRNHRKCWVIKLDETIAGIAIRKDESFEDLAEEVKSDEKLFERNPTRILKICTFKINDEFRGGKFGEQLLKQILWWSHRNNYNLIYLSVYPKHQELIDLFENYGFLTLGEREGERHIGKVFEPGIFNDIAPKSAIEYHRSYYPAFHSNANIRKYLVPIHGAYYKQLFPENINYPQLNLFDNSTLNKESQIPGNTIRKVYVCRTPTKSISPGDILLFFHLKDKASFHSQSCVTVGIVDGFHITREPNSLLRITAKRSVFSPKDLVQLTQEGTKEVKVINFYLAGHINPSISKNRLDAIGLSGSFQSIRSIHEKQFEQIEKEMNLDVKTT